MNPSTGALAGYFGDNGYNDSGESVGEYTAMSFPALYRCVNLIASTVAGLPLKSYRDGDGDVRTEVKTVWDDPGAGLFTPYEFKHLAVTHMCLHGNAFLWHVYSDGGALVGFFPVHPSLVSVRFEDGFRRFKFKIPGDDTQYDLDESDMTQIMFGSLDGLTGLSPLEAERNAIGTAIAGNKAAAKMFQNGLMIGGLVTPEETMTEADGKIVKAGLDAKMTGTANAGQLAFVNRNLKISPWSMNAVDGQFLESREHQVTEIARIYGVPPELLGQTQASSWGTGLIELTRGFQRFTLRSYTTPFEQRASLLTRGSSFVEFLYDGLLQGNPAEEIDLLIKQKEAGILTTNEVRAIRNLPPIEGGDAIATGGIEQGQPPAATDEGTA